MQVAWNVGKEYLPGLWTLSCMLFLSSFCHLSAGTMVRNRHFEVICSLLSASEDVLEILRPRASILWSGVDFPGHRGRSQNHLRHSLDRRRRPQSCAGSDQNKLIVISFRPCQRAGISLDEFPWGFGPMCRHCNDLHHWRKPFLQAMSMSWHRREHDCLISGLLHSLK